MNFKEPELVELFSTPLLISKYPKDLSKELSHVKNIKLRNQTNQTLSTQSLDTFILDKSEFKEISEFINSILKFYMRNILKCKDELIITQSWLNVTKKEQLHHDHFHPNSIISGVFYLRNDKNHPPIQFRRPSVFGFQLEAIENNNFNSETYLLPADSGELLLFPSSLYHSVLCNKTDEDRVSIAFNTFAKKSLGSIDNLTYLPIDRCV